MAPQLHSEDKQAEQLCESSAEDIEPEVQFEAIPQVVDGILPKRPRLVQADGLVVNLEEPRMVDFGSREQAEQFHGLNGEEGDDAPYGSRRQIADGDEQEAVHRIEHEDVAIVECHVDKAKDKQQAHAPGKSSREIAAFLLLVVVHDKETQSEEHGEDAIHLAREQPGKDVGYCLVAGQRMDYGLLRKNIKVLNGVIQDDARHSDSSQGIGHVNACVREFTGCIHAI